MGKRYHGMFAAMNAATFSQVAVLENVMGFMTVAEKVAAFIAVNMPWYLFPISWLYHLALDLVCNVISSCFTFHTIDLRYRMLYVTMNPPLVQIISTLTCTTSTYMLDDRFHVDFKETIWCTTFKTTSLLAPDSRICFDR